MDLDPSANKSGDESFNRWTGRAFSNKYYKILEGRQKLPVYLFKDKLIESVRDNQVVICEGETGSGKTTQVGQLMLFFSLIQNNGLI